MYKGGVIAAGREPLAVRARGLCGCSATRMCRGHKLLLLVAKRGIELDPRHIGLGHVGFLAGATFADWRLTAQYRSATGFPNQFRCKGRQSHLALCRIINLVCTQQ